jgi:hypothetical protein
MAFAGKIGRLDRSALKLGRPSKLGRFVRQLFTANLLIESDLRDLQGAVALHFIKTVVPTTPIDAGRLRTNWRIGINRKPKGHVKSLDRKARPGFHEASLSGITALVVARARNTLRALPIRSVVHIVNNSPYLDIRDKDGGTLATNKARPPLFVSRAVNASNRKFANVLDVTKMRDE